MKRFLLASACIALVYVGHAQVTSLSVETFAAPGTPNLPDGMTTYRVYANTTNANDFVSAVFGDALTPLSINSTGTIYQDPFGSSYAHTVNANIFGLLPALQYDSWLTIGKAPEDTTTSTLNNIGFSSELAAFASGQPLHINSNNGGSWFVLFPDTLGYAGADLKVLLAQITTDGTLYGTLNLQVFVNGVQANNQFATGLPFSSDPGAVFGCMDPDADNYNPLANTDTGGCVFPCSLALTVGSITPTSCANSANGSVSVIQSGAQYGILFGINLAAGAIPTQALGNFGNLPGGVHTISALDGAGCTQTLQVTVPSPAPVALNAVLSDPITCNGDTDAVIVGVASGGTGAFSYSLSGPMTVGPQASGTFSNLGAGLYTVTAVDANGCTKTNPAISVSNPSALNLYLTSSSGATCFNTADGVVVLTPMGGSGLPSSMQYSTNGVTFAPDGVAGNTGILYLAPGTYTIYVQDVNGCIGQVANPVTVTGPPAIVLNASADAVLCAGDQNGSISVLATGGTGDFSYSFEEGAGSTVTFFGDLAAGTYTISATDDSGCNATSEVVVAAAVPIQVSATATPITCNGDANGFVTGTASGGTGAYLFSIDNVIFGAGSTFGNLLPGTYTVYVEDENGCTSSSMAEVTQPAPLVLAGVVTDDNGTGNGSIDVTVAGGTTGYSFSWTGPNGFTASTQSISGIVGGTYTLTVTDANGCTATQTFDVVTGIEELLSGLALAVFPNPTSGAFTLALDGLTGEVLSWELRDLAGRLVDAEVLGARTGEVRIAFDVAEAASGVYLLNVQSGSIRSTVRVLVQH
jgi:hypothetical protein